MNECKALQTIEMMKEWAQINELSYIVAGSIGYRSALIRNSELKECDDIDCIFIYDDIAQISESPFYDMDFYSVACNSVPYKADMFSSKVVIDEIKISADFISLDYLKKLSSEEIDGNSKYRFKLTNAVEVPDNIYCDFYGRKTCYHKVWENYHGYRIYKLPIHLFIGEVFFQGALLSKFVFNPSIIVSNEVHRHYVSLIQKKVKQYCPKDGSLCNAYYKCADFSEETRKFLGEKGHE